MQIVTLIARRFATGLPTLAIVMAGAWLMLEFAPGDAADAYLAQTGGDSGFAAALRERFGLVGSSGARLLRYATGILSGDFGLSAVFNRPVATVILERIGPTLVIMSLAVGFAALLGSGMGLAAGARPRGVTDRVLSMLALGLVAMPNFWLGLVLVVVFAVNLGWLPTSGLGPPGGSRAIFESLPYLVLPVVSLGAGYAALYMRTLRAGMVETWRQDHVRAARARGLGERAVVWRAVARPALLPVVVLLGQQAGSLFGGSVVIETVFAIPGMGRLAYEAVAGRDPILLAGVALAGAVMVIFANLLADLVARLMDPRIGAADV
jgi:peptide/nickel transport system permease protein